MTSANLTAPAQKPPNEWRELLVTPTSPFSNGISTKPSISRRNPLPLIPSDFTLVVSKEPTPHSKLLPLTSPLCAAFLPTRPESQAISADIATCIGAPNSNPRREPFGTALILDYGPTQTITNSFRGIKAHRFVSLSVFPAPSKGSVLGLDERAGLGGEAGTTLRGMSTAETRLRARGGGWLVEECGPSR